MTDQTLRVVARLQARPEKVNQLRDLLTDAMVLSRDEDGCLAYELLQNKQDPTDFTLLEEWTGPDALSAHLHAPHVRTVLDQSPELLVTDPDIRAYDLVN